LCHRIKSRPTSRQNSRDPNGDAVGKGKENPNGCITKSVLRTPVLKNSFADPIGDAIGKGKEMPSNAVKPMKQSKGAVAASPPKADHTIL
jgi:hypothetical protein